MQHSFVKIAFISDSDVVVNKANCNSNSLIESNKAHMNTNKKYLYRYIHDQKNEFNKIMELLQQKKDITDQVIILLEETDMFNTIVNTELFDKVKQEMNDLHQTSMDYFMHCYHTKLSTSDDDVENDVNMSNNAEQIDTDLQCAMNEEMEIAKYRIQHLHEMVSQLDEM
ncbi:hypothetical protein K501DRAFT_273216 [Backusella circina FSU 941]|nr:hypothetical protein K501DRAFT_273216 [Backusella circina FSU 941]